MKKKIVVFSGITCAPERQEFYYGLAYQMGKLLAEAGYITVTGGGPGLMNETLRGAWEANGETIGICLTQYKEAHSQFITTKEEFSLLGPRQDRLLGHGDGFIALPGGIGTLYEISAVLALKRKGECDLSKPMLLLGSYYEAQEKMFSSMLQEGFVDATFPSIYSLVNTPDDAMHVLGAAHA